jgi:membrane-associated protease RseP (regulator of RpoE activity)
MIGAPLVDCVVGTGIQAKGMIDTGSPFGFVLPLSYVARIDAPEKIKSKGTIARWPFTTATENYLARIDHIQMGTLEIENIIALFAELPAMTTSPLIGMECLSRFKVILDYPENELILIPCDDEAFQDNLYSTGLALKTDENGKIVVRGFWEGSPADKAGLQVGGEILEINSKSTNEMKLTQIQRILEDDQVSEVKLNIRSGERERGIILVKEMLFPEIRQRDE